VPQLLQGSARETVYLYEALKNVRRNLFAIATTLDECKDLGLQCLSILENNGHRFSPLVAEVIECGEPPSLQTFR
jgi:hypothetical protein